MAIGLIVYSPVVFCHCPISVNPTEYLRTQYFLYQIEPLLDVLTYWLGHLIYSRIESTLRPDIWPERRSTLNSMIYRFAVTLSFLVPILVS